MSDRPVFTFTILFLILVVLAVKFWWTMLTDCIHNEHHNRAFWLSTLVVFNVFGAIAYFFLDKRKRKLKY
ncbi:MAG: PLDc N-terminal domain-containing protein [Methanococcaceae archaeon]